MDAKKRYLDTILFGNPDRIPLALGWPRESTLEVWRTQGMPENADFREALCGELGVSRDAWLTREWIDVKLSMIPEFEPVILDHRDRHYVIRD